MSKLIIKSKMRIKSCPFCGLNTSLLPENEKKSIDDKTYCLQCARDGISKLHIAPVDFYHFFAQGTGQLKEKGDSMFQVSKESVCNQLRRIEIAHLHGEYGREDDMYLDFFYDKIHDKPYFRMLIVDDDDPWWGTEVYTYLEAEEVPVLLNKNGIHVFDGMNESNWKSYIGFDQNE